MRKKAMLLIISRLKMLIQLTGLKRMKSIQKEFSILQKFITRIEEGFKTKIDNYQYFLSHLFLMNIENITEFLKKEKLILDVNKLAKNKKFTKFRLFIHQETTSILHMEDKNGRREFSIVVKDINNNINLENNSCSSSGKIIWNKTSDGYFYLKKILIHSLLIHYFFIN